MKVSIVILNWNGSDHLKRFLPTLIKYSTYEWAEIVVADNGSDDDSCQLIETKFPEVKLLKLDRNYGFAEGYNRALEHTNAEYILLLNSDIEVTENWLLSLVQTMENDTLIGACQPKILALSNRDQFEYAGASGGFIDRLGYPFCRGRIINAIEQDNGQYDNKISVFWTSGAATLIRTKLWHTMQGFDIDFWAHMEEIDLCWRMKNRGFNMVVVPDSTVYHLGGGTLAYGNPRKIYLNFRNNLFLLYKNLPGRLFIPTLLIRMILDGIAAIQFLITGQLSAFTRVLAAHRDFYKNLKKLRLKRAKLANSVTITNHPEIYRGSIIFDFFIAKRKKFSDLDFKTPKIK